MNAPVGAARWVPHTEQQANSGTVLPDSAVWLVPELKQNRQELIGLERRGRLPRCRLVFGS